MFVGVVEAALAVPASTASLMASAMLKICKFSMKRFGSSSRLTLKRLRQVFCKVRAMVLPSKAMESPKTLLLRLIDLQSCAPLERSSRYT